MRPLKIEDSPVVIAALQDEIRRTNESRYDHRLHGLLLVAQGMRCSEVARVLGDAPRTVQYWVRQYEAKGLAGLQDGDRPGRPRRLNAKQWREVGQLLRSTPVEAGVKVNLWDGKALSALLRKRYDVLLGTRQCQRMFKQFGFRLRKPRPALANADPVLQQEYKKTPRISRRSQRRRVGPR